MFKSGSDLARLRDELDNNNNLKLVSIYKPQMFSYGILLLLVIVVVDICYWRLHPVVNPGGGGGGLTYKTDGDARRHFQKKPLKVTILGVAPANFIP